LSEPNEATAETRHSWLTPLRADGIMLLAALIWGLGFIAQIIGARHLGPLSFTGFRFGLAALLLAPFLLRSRPSRDDLVGGLSAGTVMAMGAILQQWGMGSTTAANGGFITATYVVIAPLLAVVLGQRVRWPVWCGVALVLPGLWFLSIEGDFVVRSGDPIILACAVAWAVHILLMGHWAGRVNAVNFAGVQFAVTGAAGLALGLPLEAPAAANILAASGAIAFAAIFPTVIAFTLQAIAQRVAPAAHSAILLSLEAAFAMVAGAVLLGEPVTVRKLLGAGLMLAGMLVAQRSVKPSPST
jgi:drug/metabolite transporter (DMT)-like permease